MRHCGGLRLRPDATHHIHLPTQLLTRHPIPVAIEPCHPVTLQVESRFFAQGHVAAEPLREAASAQAAMMRRRTGATSSAPAVAPPFSIRRPREPFNARRQVARSLFLLQNGAEILLRADLRHHRLVKFIRIGV